MKNYLKNLILAQPNVPSTHSRDIVDEYEANYEENKNVPNSSVIPPLVQNTETDIAIDRLKNLELFFKNKSIELENLIQSNIRELDKVKQEKEKNESEKFQCKDELDAIEEYKIIISKETITLNAFTDKMEEIIEKITHKASKTYYYNINKEVVKFIYELNNQPKDHDNYLKDTESKYYKIEYNISKYKKQIEVLKNKKVNNEEDLRKFRSKISAINDFKKYILNSLQEQSSTLEAAQEGGRDAKLSNKIHEFIISLNKTKTVVIKNCRHCHGSMAGCSHCDSTGWEINETK